MNKEKSITKNIEILIDNEHFGYQATVQTGCDSISIDC
jgi:hypothetical protein